MIILIDLDDVTANLRKKWVAIYNAEYEDNLQVEDLEEWQIALYAKKCTSEKFHSIIERPHFFADLEVFPDSIDATTRLQQSGHNIYFVTATPHDSITAGYDKYKWVQRWFPHIGQDHVIQAHHKYMIKGDILFDDSPSNLEDFPGIKVAKHFPYNTNVKVDYRVINWNQFEMLINKIAK